MTSQHTNIIKNSLKRTCIWAGEPYEILKKNNAQLKVGYARIDPHTPVGTIIKSIDDQVIDNLQPLDAILLDSAITKSNPIIEFGVQGVKNQSLKRVILSRTKTAIENATRTKTGSLDADAFKGVLDDI